MPPNATSAEFTSRGTVVGATVVLAIVWSAAVVVRLAGPGLVPPIDSAVDAAMTHARMPSLTAVADFLAWFGTGWPAVTMWMVAIVGVAVATREWRPAAVVAVTSVVSVTDTALIKQAAARLRPDPIHFAAATSFPSGHTANVAALAVSIALVLRRRLVSSAAVAYVMAMALSRSYLHAHWITDVIAGAAAGAAFLVHAAVRLNQGTPQPHTFEDPVASPRRSGRKRWTDPLSAGRPETRRIACVDSWTGPATWSG